MLVARVGSTSTWQPALARHWCGTGAVTGAVTLLWSQEIAAAAAAAAGRAAAAEESKEVSAAEAHALLGRLAWLSDEVAELRDSLRSAQADADAERVR